MRIVQVTDARSWRGGEEQLFLLTQGLIHRYGVEVFLVCPPGTPVFQRFQAAGLPAYPVGMRQEWDPLRALTLRRLLQDLAPDLVVAQSSGAHGLLVLAAHLTQDFPPLVVHRRRPSSISLGSRWKYRSGTVARYIAISKAVAQTLIQGGVEPERITVIPSGIPIPPHPPVAREKLGIPKSTPLIGTVAALTREKNLFFWLEVLKEVRKEVPEVMGLIVGEGYLQSALQRAVREKGLEGHVRLLPYRPGIIGTFDLFLSTSRVEGLGTALIQALAYGVPVVAPQIGGIPEVIRHGETGILIGSWAPRAFAKALVDLLTEPHKRNSLAREALKDVERFSIRHTVDQTYTVYREVITSWEP